MVVLDELLGAPHLLFFLLNQASCLVLDLLVLLLVKVSVLKSFAVVESTVYRRVHSSATSMNVLLL